MNIEQYERWQKMSFRNRCIVAGANGLLNLSIPVEGGRNSDRMIRDVKIDNSDHWQNKHWRAIVSAYNRSPWFEFYKDDMSLFYNTKYVYLWDWNMDMLKWTVKQLGADIAIDYTTAWQKEYPNNRFLDMRNRVLPKNYLDFASNCPIYTQVFEDRIGFNPNLSIIDLLFCEGKNAIELLRS